MTSPLSQCVNQINYSPLPGYNSDMMLTPLIDMKREYLQRGDYNLFFVDWSVLGPAPCKLKIIRSRVGNVFCFQAIHQQSTTHVMLAFASLNLLSALEKQEMKRFMQLDLVSVLRCAIIFLCD